MRLPLPFWLLLASLCMAATASAGESKSDVIALSAGQVGLPPANFDIWIASGASTRDWSVVRETSAEGQLAIKNTGSRGNELAVFRPLSAANVTAKVRFKLIAGKRPTAGIALRVIDPDDYYVVRVDAFGGRIAFDHVVRGKAEEVAGVDADISEDHWQSLEIAATGDTFKISLDGIWVVTAFERSPPSPGKIALWSDQNSTALFDSIEINPLPPDIKGGGRNRGMGG